MRRTANIAFVVMGFTSLCLALFAHAEDRLAVTSTGEINAKDNSAGRVSAGSTAELLVALIADMSEAVPGEEIRAIRITMPLGFSAGEKAVTAVNVAEDHVPDFKSVVDRSRIIITLPNLIAMSSSIVIEFAVNTPAQPATDQFFIVALLNDLQNPIIVSVAAGNADGRLNNDKLTIDVILATKPLPPSDLRVLPDPSGENDLVLSWTMSDDPAVSGYLVYRDGDQVGDVDSRMRVSYTDRNLKSRAYSYVVRSYKTKVLMSVPSNEASATATEDTKAPDQPVIEPETKVVEKGSKEGVEIRWQPSKSGDVVNYVIYRGESLDSLDVIHEISDPAASSYVDEDPPAEGRYLNVVAAVDEAGNETKSSPTLTRQVLSDAKPQPNPFTPLSADPTYNQITFPAAMVEGGEGTFAITVYDLEGDVVFDEQAEGGSKEIKWDGKDADGKYVNGGIYIYQATVGSGYKIGTIIVAK